MYKNRFKKSAAVFCQSVDSEKKPIGQRAFTRFSDGGFELNEFGYIRNDISQLLSVQNELSFSRAIQRFKQNQLDCVPNFPAGLSHEELISQLRPRWCQLPFQQRAFAEYLTEERAAEVRKEIEAYQEQIKKSASTTAFDSAAAPAPAPGPAVE